MANAFMLDAPIALERLACLQGASLFMAGVCQQPACTMSLL